MDVNVLIQGGVDINKALEVLGDMETYNETLQDFLNEYDEKVGNLKKYKDEQDMANYAIYAHSLKSDSKYLGFTTLAELSYNHEMAGKANDLNYVLANYDTLMKEATRIVNLVKSYLTGAISFNENPQVSNANTKKILVADDSNIIRNFVQKMIPAGYSVLVANNGEEAINLIRMEAGNLKGVLLDLNMPKVNGFQVLDFFKENQLFDKIPVTVITGDDSKDTVMKAFDYPIVDVLNKPFTEGNVKDVVTKMMNYTN